MAEAVECALREERVLLCEAGTGTGKTLAYLLPAILSGRKVVVSTATRALQEQIVEKDLPLVSRAFGLAPRVAVMKGLSNYICLRRYREFLASAEALRPMYARALAALASFVEDSERGDVGELAGLSESDAIWREVTASSDTRLGQACAHYDACFVTRMKRQAEAAQIVVVNHHLFFADLALRGPHPGRVIPDYDAVIFDEAHQLEEIATDFFGLRVSETRILRVLRDTERALAGLGLADPLFAGRGAHTVLYAVRAATHAFFEELSRVTRAADGRATIERDIWQGSAAERWHALDTALEGLSALLESVCGRAALPGATSKSLPKGAALDALELGGRRAESLREQLAAIVEGARGRVTWFERSSNNAVLSSSPIDVASVFRARVFETIPSIVLTSATLANGAASAEAEDVSGAAQKSAFGFVRERLGLTATALTVSELVVHSPFDFERRALFYTPRDLPPPGAPRFIGAAAERAAELIEITRGGAFVLTTSVRSMRALHEQLQRRTRHTVLVQGQMPKGALIRAFRAEGDAVLVATSSFWEGVDVPGRALRLVVLEKIPFPVPSDPVVQARSLALESEGKNAFMDYHVPSAALTLKQGFGRLIRTRSDAGIVALLDPRVHQRGYGRRLLSGLPNAARTEHLSDVSEFWRALESQHAGSAALAEAPL